MADNSLKCNCESTLKEGAASDESESNSVIHCCLKQKLWSMLQNKHFCDVCFIVVSKSEIEEVHAHKSVLSVSSTVFEAMFSSSERSEIKVSDIEPSVFSSLLRFIYTNDIHLEADSVMKVLYAAKKYAITTLENQCTKFLTQQLCPENACLLLTQARLFDKAKLVESCLAMIDENPADALMSDSFMNIDLAALRSILERDTLKISEIDLFASAIRWSAAQCEKKNLSVTPENQKLVLEDVLLLIRFPLMTQNEFTSSVMPLELLSKEEALDVYVQFSGCLKPSSSVTSIPQLSRKRFSNSEFSKTRFSKKPRLGDESELKEEKREALEVDLSQSSKSTDPELATNKMDKSRGKVSKAVARKPGGSRMITNMRIVIIAKRIKLLKGEYEALKKALSLNKCYAIGCSPSTLNQCYSPICAHTYRIQQELIALLKEITAAKKGLVTA